MPDLDNAAADIRSRLGIPAINAPENRNSSLHDGWYVSARGARYIGLLRRYRGRGVRLIARELMEHMRREPIAAHVSRSFTEMDAAGHHVDDPALVLAIISRERNPRGSITTSSTYRCSYDWGGLDSAWRLRHRLPLPPAIRRRMRPATDIRGSVYTDRRGNVCEHDPNEAGFCVYPADVRGSDQVILYAAYVLRAERQLCAQVRRVFPEDGDARMAEWTTATRRAWTQLSFGRGGGGGLLRALRRVRDQGATLESIFTDPALVEADSVKRARVTAGDAALIQRFVLRRRPRLTPLPLEHGAP